MKKEFRDSIFCKEEAHDDCPHWAGRSSKYVSLCHCSCHRGCPLHGDSVRTDVSVERCSCVGAATSRTFWEEARPRLEGDRQERARAIAERKEKLRAAIESVESELGKGESDIREELVRVFRERDIDPVPIELDVIAGAIRATNAPFGLKTVQTFRVLGRFVRQMTSTIRDSKESGSSDIGTDG